MINGFWRQNFLVIYSMHITMYRVCHYLNYPVLVGAGPTVQTQAVADAWVLALEDSGIAAEVREVEDVNGDWFHGSYMGAQGLFPSPYVRVVER